MLNQLLESEATTHASSRRALNHLSADRYRHCGPGARSRRLLHWQADRLDEYHRQEDTRGGIYTAIHEADSPRYDFNNWAEECD